MSDNRPRGVGDTVEPASPCLVPECDVLSVESGPSGGTDPTNGDAEEFLDGMLDRAIELLLGGEEPDAVLLADAHPDLIERVRGVIALARGVVPRSNGGTPCIDGYTVLAEIGRGGMGAVYLARQERLGGRPVALKVLAGASLSRGARSRFRRESEAIARLRHPNIVGVHDVIEHADPPAFAMEWIDGRSLAAIIDHVRRESATGLRMNPAAVAAGVRSFITGAGGGAEMPAPDAIWSPTWMIMLCRVGITIARALAAVHQAGMLHRDVKPSNILIRGDGRAMLTDFGLAEPQGRIEGEGDGGNRSGVPVVTPRRFAGTPAYAPPELLRGTGQEVDARSDVYSLGVTLYHALSLQLPYHGQRVKDVLRRIDSGRCKPLRDIDRRIPRDLETIVATAMEQDPARRYPSALELADDLDRLLNLQPIQARPTGSLHRAFKALRRNRRALAAAIGGAALVFMLAAGTYLASVVLPRKSDAALREARVLLLHPMFVDQVMSLPDDLVVVQPRWAAALQQPVALDQRLYESTGRFDMAVRLAPWRSGPRLERDLVRAARLIWSTDSSARRAPDRSRGRSIDPPPDASMHPLVDSAVETSLARSAPLAFRFLQSALHGGRGTEGLSIPDDTSDAELRSAGILAFLAGDGRAAQSFWVRMSQEAKAEPFISALLAGIAFANRQWERVYVQLHLARHGFPDVAFLTIGLADAALQLGHVEEAQALLRAAEAEGERRPAFRDASESERRVLAGCLAARGEDQAAIGHYEHFRQHKQHPSAREAYARFLLSRGRFQDATVVALELLAIRPRPRFEGLFVECAAAWRGTASGSDEAFALEWLGASDAAKWETCVTVLYARLASIEPPPPAVHPPLKLATQRSPGDGTLPPSPDWLRKKLQKRCATEG